MHTNSQHEHETSNDVHNNNYRIIASFPNSGVINKRSSITSHDLSELKVILKKTSKRNSLINPFKNDDPGQGVNLRVNAIKKNSLICHEGILLNIEDSAKSYKTIPEEEVKKINEMTLELFDLGFKMEAINKIYNKYRFKSISEAVALMSYDNFTGFYNHIFFYDVKDDNFCAVCGDVKNKHQEESNLSLSVWTDAPRIGQSNKTYKQNLDPNNESSSCNENNITLKKKSEVKPSLDFLKKLELNFENTDNLCQICFGEDLAEGNLGNLACGHNYCKSCIQRYLKGNITSTNVNVSIDFIQLDFKYKMSG